LKGFGPSKAFHILHRRKAGKTFNEILTPPENYPFPAGIQVLDYPICDFFVAPPHNGHIFDL
jgi:hypothetical protein